ncbi:MAG TPA: amino acid adenylation domain-containing protein [Pseudonocardiaceae bacterium]|jgi:amino acid adenylation domain-containing protein|nr:amino acid adenylation domain-containing protein [Pseudonocardiaceae bacterium]
MRTAAGADRTFWSEALGAGGGTAIPRWTLDPVSGVATHDVSVPQAVRGLADEFGVPVRTLVLAAHAKVLAALSGDQEVVAGYARGGRVLPCALSAAPTSWRALVVATAAAEAELLRHQDFPVAELAAELGLPVPEYETVFGDGDGDPADGVVLCVAATDDRIRLTYRTDALDTGSVARIAGYHVTALEQLAGDPDAAHESRDLLSDDERAFQLDGLAGSHRPLPDVRCHELFEQQVRAHPDRVAAELGERRWTYAELNARANHLAGALLARGLRREDVVAVVTERNLDWMAALLAVFKAGGAYLPIEPHFPADRIATTLSRAGCRLVLTEQGGTDTLKAAVGSLTGVDTIFVTDAYAEDHAEDDLGVPVSPDQLAYIYFTSGSTGEPKGAMCEHAGLLNHLHAKIDDLGITDTTVVAQTAPQCFDISLWQLVAAVLVGGRTLIVPQDVILDVERFVDTIAGGHVGVAQVVPSYLEVVLSYVEQHPRGLPDLRVVSVTGEALKRELAQRWFAAEPDIKLANAYGLTETSDDTNHEVMDRAPDRVSLGSPISNVRIYVVDDDLRPVPLGAPGQIVFSGVCVGRGYVNDPELTRQAFLADPYQPGERLYRAGDYGRWLPDGKLDFLGRRDNQVKISGFRIEIGEIENTLLRVPGVRDGAVVVIGGADRAKRLVACYAAREPLAVNVLRERLGESLPDYMVPSAFHWRQTLPLTGNGKIDRKSLTALATELDAADEQDYSAPATPTERRLAAAWATVLGVTEDQIGRQDHFFERGGTSLSAVKVAIALRRKVSLKDVTRHPVLADLAGVMDDRSRRKTGLLHPMSESDDATALVCFPYAGGNAVNFQPLAAALRGRGIAVYAVELPGHDLAAEREPFAPLEKVVEQVAAEIVAREPANILLWGHSAGAAFAVATAFALRDQRVDVRHVFLAGQLLGEAQHRLTSAERLAAMGDAEIAADLAGGSGYTALGELDGQRAQQVGSAFRHDLVSAHRYLASAITSPPARLTTPVTVVAAADDPITAGFGKRYHDWGLLAEHVDAAELTGGGHYFIRTRPTETAATVVRSTHVPVSS